MADDFSASNAEVDQNPNNYYKCYENEETGSTKICENYNSTTNNITDEDQTSTSTTTEITTTDKSEAVQNDGPYVWEQTSFLFALGCICVGLFLTLMSKFYKNFLEYRTKKRALSDGAHFVIWLYFQSLADFWTDLFFAIILYFENYDILCYNALFFTIGPFIMNLVVGIKYILYWKQYTQNNGTIRLQQYLNKYEFVIYLLLIAGAGFYNTIDVLKSNVFYLKLFHFQIKSNEYDQLKKYKFINITVFENIPQLTIQLFYLLYYNYSSVFGNKSVDNDTNLFDFSSNSDDGSSDSTASPIVFLSMVFSVVSLIFALIKEISRIAYNKSLEKHENSQMNYTSIIDGILTIESKNLNNFHNFCHSRLKYCLNSVLDTCDNSQLWANRSDTYYKIEIYFIKDMIHTMHQIQAFFQITVNHTIAPTNHINGDKNMIDTFCNNLENIGVVGSQNREKMIDMLQDSVKLATIDDIVISPLVTETKDIESTEVQLAKVVSMSSYASNSSQADISQIDSNNFHSPDIDSNIDAISVVMVDEKFDTGGIDINKINKPKQPPQTVTQTKKSDSPSNSISAGIIHENGHGTNKEGIVVTNDYVWEGEKKLQTNEIEPSQTHKDCQEGKTEP